MSTIQIYNIILLGPTGAGKSTFVNACANYFAYETLEEALENNEPQSVIPSSYEITLSNFKKIPITIRGINSADAGNENTTGASSCTQQPRVYSFYNQKVGFNVIDIPGIGDTRGTAQDAKNKKIIIDKLRQFKKIHGIFIMFKAFEPRLTQTMKYNLNETLMMLHANAVPNIMFIITTSRGADYHPGETMTTLQDYVADLKAKKNITIELSPDTVFCVDNEAYRYQCGWNRSEEYRKEFGPLIANYTKSWEVSRKAVFKLFEQMYTIQGHDVQLSCAVGQARTIIHCAIGPLSSITTLIQQALTPASRQANIRSLTSNGQQIQSKIDIQNTQSRTVCTSKKCIEAIPIPGTNRYNFNFKTVCHDNCFLKNVPLARFPEPALEDCQIFENGICKHCGCSITRHMHISLQQIQQQQLKKVAAKPLTKEEAEKFMDIFIEALKLEQQEIIKAIVKLSSYLKHNAILEYNNAFEERIKLDIRKEEAALDAGSKDAADVIKRLETTLTLYKNEMKAIDASLIDKSLQIVTEKDVNEVMSTLFSLQHNGAHIRKLYGAECSKCEETPEVKSVNPREVLHYKAKFLP